MNKVATGLLHKTACLLIINNNHSQIPCLPSVGRGNESSRLHGQYGRNANIMVTTFKNLQN